MNAKKSITVGQRFGGLVLVEPAGVHIQRGGRKRHLWLCQCDCGGMTVIRIDKAVEGSVSSCGCARVQSLSKNRNRVPPPPRTTHGMFGTRVYRIWRKMIERCTRKKNENFSRYGGRGIKVCEAWRHDFSAFFSYMGEPPTNKHTLDRINNDLGYEPGNCRWATPQEQARNKRGDT